MPLSVQEWHNRYQIQAQWTRALRLYFFELLKSHTQDKILDIGCGTGALLPDLQALSPAEIYGADIDLDNLSHAQATSPDSHLSGADVFHLPFGDDLFNLVLCHYFLLWTGNPAAALKEMVRITADQGFIVAFAEPDYGGRIDYPLEFIQIREHQITSLITAGADPRMGRSLKGLFSGTGFSEIVCGVYDGAWHSPPSSCELESEWAVLEEDLSGILSQAEIAGLKKQDQAAREKGTRLIYVPTFYAWGKVSKTS
jgi:ubiquinone/menaquinone biosynthesis C-methylase UbiE